MNGLDVSEELTADLLVRFLRSEAGKFGFERVVCGLSGGVDSAVSVALAAQAFGPENVLGVMMPYRTSNPSSEADACVVAKALGITTRKVDISDMADGYLEGSDVTDRIGRIQASDTASLIWTSGTTGRSKGCVLSHGNFDVEIDAIHEIERFGPGQGYISYLPASHIFEQVAAGRMHIHDAMHMSICASPLQAIDYAKEAHPSLMNGVPRI